MQVLYAKNVLSAWNMSHPHFRPSQHCLNQDLRALHIAYQRNLPSLKLALFEDLP